MSKVGASCKEYSMNLPIRTNIWWSPIPGALYRVNAGDRMITLGSWAEKNPGLFNLYWVFSGLPLPSDKSFVKAFDENFNILLGLSKLTKCNIAVDLEDIGQPCLNLKSNPESVNDWAVFLTEKEFAKSLSQNQVLAKMMYTAVGQENVDKWLQKTLATCL